MEKTVSPAKAAVNYGVIFGVIMIVEFVLAYTLDIDPIKNPTVGIVNNLLNYLVLPIVFIAMACNYFKKMNGGYATFGQCLKAGVSTTVLAAVVFSIFNIVFNLIFPEFKDETMDKIKEITVQQNPNMTSEQLEMALKWTEMFMNPFISAAFAIIWYALLGLIFSLIVGAIVKKDNPGAFN